MQTQTADIVRPERTAVRRGVYWLDGLQIAVAVVVVAACCRGEGHPFRWLAAAFVLPVGRILTVPSYRQQVLDFLRRLWRSLETYATSDGQAPWLAVFVFAVVPSLVLFVSNDHGIDTGDTWPVIPTAASLTTAGSWTLDAYLDKAPPAYTLADHDGLPYCTIRLPGGVYSTYPSGVVPFAVPVAAAARLLGADLSEPKVQKHLEKWVASCVSALAVGLFFLIALRLARPLPALLTTGLLATGSAVLSTCAQNVWQHDGVIFWSLLALCVEFRRPWRERLDGVLLQGLACGMLPACRLSAALFLVPFGLWVLCRSPRRAILLVGVAALVYAPWAYLYNLVYGTPLGPSTAQLQGANWSWDLGYKLACVLVSPSHGLLIYQPWLLLAAGALLTRRAGRDEPTAWRWLVLIVIGLQVGLVATWRCWWGGDCWGSRLVCEAVPLGALLCVRPVAALWQLRGGRLLLGGVAGVAFALHAVAVYSHADYWGNYVQVDRHPEMLWSWSHAPFFYPFQRH